MNQEKGPPSLPSAKPTKLAANVTLQPPLSRRGHGPGLILLVPAFGRTKTETLDPQPILKWAEEGYAVVEVVTSGNANISEAVVSGVEALTKLPECSDKDKFGLVVYDELAASVASDIYKSSPKFVAAISHGAALTTSKPCLAHLSSNSNSNVTKSYIYPNVTSSFFPLPGHTDFSYAAEALAHSRSLAFLKPLIGGPYFDLEAVWEEHTSFEFGNRNVENTMATMVQEPYVNHIPTMTGGLGRERLTNFYRHHFIFSNPDDVKLELVSRTVGIDRVIDEFVYSFTHDKVVDWLIPGLPPTGKYVEIPMTSVVNVRGDRLYHENISWDQATVLVQLGVMPGYLPWPYPVEGMEGRKMEFRVPAAGVETAQKLMDKHCVESNEMFGYAVREVGS